VILSGFLLKARTSGYFLRTLGGDGEKLSATIFHETDMYTIDGMKLVSLFSNMASPS